jgi:hypothetical protein
MAVTRRRFLRVLGIAAGGAAAAGAIAYRFAKGRAGEYYRRLVELPAEGELGAIGDAELEALMAATVSLVGREIDLARYEDFFRWHAEHALGYRRLYSSFTAAVDRAAREAGAPKFAGAPEAIQTAALSKAREVRVAINRDDKARALMFAMFDREWLLFERYVVREILTLFARTDAWVLSGYGAPPGLPRGLEAYRRAPEGR